jgi:hypothetical protein
LIKRVFWLIGGRAAIGIRAQDQIYFLGKVAAYAAEKILPGRGGLLLLPFAAALSQRFLHIPSANATGRSPPVSRSRAGHRRKSDAFQKRLRGIWDGFERKLQQIWRGLGSPVADQTELNLPGSEEGAISADLGRESSVAKI